MILISNDFWHIIKMYNFAPYNVLLAIVTNIAVLLMTASVLQGHIFLEFVSFITHQNVAMMTYGLKNSSL